MKKVNNFLSVLSGEATIVLKPVNRTGEEKTVTFATLCKVDEKAWTVEYYKAPDAESYIDVRYYAEENSPAYMYLRTTHNDGSPSCFYTLF